jgi:seryl-tRNA synthetase
MIDLNLLRQAPQEITARIQKKDPQFDVAQLIRLDNESRAVRQHVEELRHKKNELADKAKGGITDALRAESIEVGKLLKTKQQELDEIEQAFKALYLTCPNLPSDDVPPGNKESNKVVREFGTKKKFSFEPKNHVELAEKLGWLDFETAAKVVAGGFVFFKKDAVKLQYALTMFMLKNNMEYGFEPVLPPVLVNETSLETSGNFPKFRDQVYTMPEDELYLSPTSEVGLANIYRNEIIPGAALPIRMTAWTSCFRREAGGYGSTERGLIRIHQFEKVELYTICKPENSSKELDLMLECSEAILKKLGLHYRVSLLAGQDCSFQSAKTYDIEVWLPGQKEYYEVSSCSNCTDFQARRGLIRYKDTPDSKTNLVHTLNCSSLALPRLIVAIMETYQQEDGTIAIPDILKKEALFSV